MPAVTNHDELALDGAPHADMRVPGLILVAISRSSLYSISHDGI